MHLSFLVDLPYNCTIAIENDYLCLTYRAIASEHVHLRFTVDLPVKRETALPFYQRVDTAGDISHCNCWYDQVTSALSLLLICILMQYPQSDGPPVKTF